jgi:hypothetical protein
MGADLPMILHESALFSRGCKRIPLRVVPCQVTAKASASQAPWGVPRKLACNVVETAQRKSQGDLSLDLGGAGLTLPTLNEIAKSVTALDTEK